MIGQFESWEDLARHCKAEWTREGLPDMPPAAIALRAGVALAMAVAPEVHRDLGLYAARLLRRSFDADEVAFISDGYCTRQGADSPLARGDLQAMWAAGRRESVREALLCVVAGRDRARMVSIPYVRSGRRLEWLEVFGSDSPGGEVPAFLGQVMGEPLLVDHPLIAASAVDAGFDRERSLFHVGRASLRQLEGEGFRVFDLVTRLHPEWADQVVGRRDR